MEAALAAAKAADTVVLVMGIDGTCRKRRALVGCVFPYACPETVLADRSSFARNSPKIYAVSAGTIEAEGHDRANTTLPGTQPELVKSVLALGKPTVLVPAPGSIH